MAKKFTGIEITPHSIRKAEITLSGGEKKVTSFFEHPFGQRSAEETLAGLVEEKKIEPGGLCTGIEGGKVFFRETTFPFSEKKKVLQTLPFTLADTLPFPVEEAFYGCYPFRSKEGKTVVSSLTVKKESLLEVERIFSSAGLTLAVITAESDAVSSLFRPSGEGGGNYLSLHLGRERTIVSFIEEGCPVFTRTLGKGMQALPAALTSALGLSEAETTGLLMSDNNDRYEKKTLKGAEKIVKDFLNALIRDIVLTIRSFGIKGEGTPPIVIAGEGAGIEGLAGYLAAEMETTVSSPLLPEDLIVAEGVSVEELCLKGGVSLGYALRGADEEGINFIAGRSRLLDAPLIKAFYAKRKAIIAGSAALLLLYTVSLAVSLGTHKKRHDLLAEGIRRTFLQALPETKRVVNEKQQLKTALSELENRVALISDKGNIKIVDILREITERVPEKAHLRVTRMRMGNDEVKLEGETENFDDVEKIKNGLLASSYFESVEVGGAKASRLQNIIEFQLNIKLAK